MAYNKIENFLAKIKLSSYINSRVIEVENDDGIKEKGIFIPIEINELFLTPRNNVISWVYMTQKLYEPIDGLTHYAKMKVSRNHLDKLGVMGYKPPYLGGMKPIKIFTSYQENKKWESRTPKKVSIEDYE